jgi:protein arginine N-methyltransferase 1
VSAQYQPADYDAMLADPVRTPAYLAAIARTVRPGDVIVEIGTGLGYFAVAACRAGAKRVYAIERTPSVVLAEKVVAENGFSDRVTCIKGDAATVSLPEPGTVLLADLRGMLPLAGDGIPTIVAARQRLLAPGARLIPVRDRILAAPCGAPGNWRRVEGMLGEAFAGISRRAVMRVARNSPRQLDVAPDDLRADPLVLTTLDYHTIASPNMDAKAAWTLRRGAVIEGFVLWFEADLCDGVRFTTEPAAGRTVYSHAFLPLERPIAADAGDRLDVHFRATLADGDYVYAWDTGWTRAGGAQVLQSQSSLTAALSTASDLGWRSSAHRPLQGTGGLLAELLRLVDGQATQGEIAAALRARHPGRFRSEGDALTWVVKTLAAINEIEAGPGPAGA